MNYRDMEIEASDAALARVDKARTGSFRVRALRSPAGEMRPEEAIAVTYDDRQLQVQLQRLADRKLDRAALVALGRALAALLLPPAAAPGVKGVGDLFAESLLLAGDDGLRLRLRLPPQLAALPWEYLYVERAGGEGVDGFVALDPRVAIVRHEALAAPAPPPLASGALKVVAAFASPEGLPPLDLAQERANMERALGQPGIAPVYLPDATLPEVQAALSEAEIFHFAGHGAFARQPADLPGTYSGAGAVALFDREVGAEQLGVNLRGNGVRLAVLGGCETGRRDGVSVWSGVAPALVKAEVPAVVANQLPITDACAIAFSQQFYGALVGGLPIERAVSAGRVAAFNADPDGRDWGVGVLYLRAEHGDLFAGAGDTAVRDAARQQAEAVVHVRVGAVDAAGSVLGARVGVLRDDTITVSVETGDIAGTVTGATARGLESGTLTTSVTGGAVTGGTVTGGNFDV